MAADLRRLGMVEAVAVVEAHRAVLLAGDDEPRRRDAEQHRAGAGAVERVASRLVEAEAVTRADDDDADELDEAAEARARYGVDPRPAHPNARRIERGTR